MLTGHTGERSRLDDPSDRIRAHFYAQAYTNGTAARRAFTLVEIMVVLTILAALMAMGFGGFRHLRENAGRDATRALVEAVANGIAARGPELSVRSGATVRSLAIWDVNRDGFIDGQGLDISGVTDGALLIAAGYAGLTPDVVEIPERFRDAQGRPIDAWKRPLRYAYAPNRRDATGAYVRDVSHLFATHRDGADAHDKLAERLGSKGFVVWSAGPDGIDFHLDPNIPDDNIYAAP